MGEQREMARLTLSTFSGLVCGGGGIVSRCRMGIQARAVYLESASKKIRCGLVHASGGSAYLRGTPGMPRAKGIGDSP